MRKWRRLRRLAVKAVLKRKTEWCAVCGSHEATGAG